MSSADKLEELNLSQDEIRRFTEAMHKPEFKELFFEYAQEISDPANRALYEAEITQMENERGMDIKFLNPDPGYVIKTTVDGKKKAFVNICKNENIGKPLSTKQIGEDGRVGLNWSLPHSFTPPREDLAKDGAKCVVYDFVVHPDTYRMAETNSRFKKMVNEMALDGIKKMFNVEVDTKNVRFPKLKYKGAPTASVLRSKRGEGPVKPDLEDSLPAKFPYPYDDKTSEEKAKQQMADNQRLLEKKKAAESLKKEKPQLEEEFTVPKYQIKYRTDIDIQDFANNYNSRDSARPKYLIVEIELPLLRSADSISLDVFEKQLKLVSHKPAKYKLDINFAYPVDENEGSAKLDKSKNKLIVTLPVLPGQAHTESDFNEKNGQNVGKSDEIDGKTDSGKEEFELLTGQAENRKPLIEVISEQVSEATEHEPASREDDANSETIIKDFHDSAGSRTIHNGYAYVLPEFQCKEDKSSVCFVFDAKNVKKDSLASTVLQQNVMVVRMSSVGDGGFPVHYSCYLKFDDGCTIETSRCTLAVNAAQNVTLLLVKGKNSQEPWRHFMVGIDAECLKEREIDSMDDFDSPDPDAGHSTTFSPTSIGKTLALANDLLEENTREQIGRVSLDEFEDTSIEKETPIAIVHDNKVSVSEADDCSVSVCLSQEINATTDEDMKEDTSRVLASCGPRLKKYVSFKDEAVEPNAVTNQGVISQIHAAKDNVQDPEECSVGQHLKQAIQQRNDDGGCRTVDVDISEHEGKLCLNGQESGDAETSLHRQNCPVKKESLTGISACDDSTSSSFVEHTILENGNSDKATSDKFISENNSCDNITNDEAILNCISTDGAATRDALDKSDAEEEKQCQDFMPTAIPLISECIEPSAPLKSDAVKTKLAAELTNKFVYDFDMD